MSEQKFQKKIIDALERKGYYVLKLMKTNKNGIPDLLALKNDHIFFLEVKTEKGVVSPLQEYRINELNNLGFDAKIIKPSTLTKILNQND